MALQPEDSLALHIQLAVLSTLGAVYLVLAALWVPPQGRVLLPMGLAAFAGAVWAGWTSRSVRDAGKEPMVVWAALLVLLVMVPIIVSPRLSGRGFLTAFLGVFCALGFWAVCRYPDREAGSPADHPRSVWKNVLWGLGWAAVMAVGYSLIALAIALVSLVGRPSLFTNFAIGYVIAAYWAGGLIGGAIVGLLRPLARWPLGRMLIGIPAAAAVYGAIGVAIILIERSGVQLTDAGVQDMTWMEQFWTALGIGFVVGPVGALYFQDMKL